MKGSTHQLSTLLLAAGKPQLRAPSCPRYGSGYDSNGSSTTAVTPSSPAGPRAIAALGCRCERADRSPDRAGLSAMTEAIEITTFRLVAGRTAKDFVAANADINEWLKRQPGFQSRRIAELDDGSIVDMLIWTVLPTPAQLGRGRELHISATPCRECSTARVQQVLPGGGRATARSW
jgi:hypothetical protein